MKEEADDNLSIQEKTAVQLMVEYKSHLLDDAIRLCKDHSEAEDLVMIVFETAIREIEKFDEKRGNFYNWLSGILAHKYADTKRRAVARGTIAVDPQCLAEDETLVDTTTDDDILRRSDCEFVRMALDRLEPKYRQALTMYYLNELSIVEIARMLSTSASTISRRIQIGKKILAAKLAPEFGKVRKPLALLGACLLGLGLFAAGAIALVGGAEAPKESVLQEVIAKEQEEDTMNVVQTVKVATVSAMVSLTFNPALANDELVEPAEYNALATSDDVGLKVIRTPAGLAYVFTTTDEEFTLTAQDDVQIVKALLVGGGGAGGWTIGGGGGGGAVRELVSVDLPSQGVLQSGQSATIFVGKGGENVVAPTTASAGASHLRPNRGGSGSASTLTMAGESVVAGGGGGGGSWANIQGLAGGAVGGNGGGGAGGWPNNNQSAQAAGAGGEGDGNGHAGGTGFVKAGTHAYNGAGGGGGAGGEGASATEGASGNGGAAVESTILGRSEWYGGGGGGGTGNSVTIAGIGGTNAGNGAPATQGALGGSAPDGFGGGGGGGGFTGNTDTTGGDGGNGTVILLVKKYDGAPVVNPVPRMSADLKKRGTTFVTIDLALNFLGDGATKAMVSYAVAPKGASFAAATVVEADIATGWAKTVMLDGLEKGTEYVIRFSIQNDLGSSSTTEIKVTTRTGTKVTIVGDSYSTYSGTMPSGYDTWYTGSNNGVTSVEMTWWKQFINRIGGTLEVNNAWSGSWVCTGGKAPMIGDSRLDQLGDPDIILVCGGTNDSWSGGQLGSIVYHDNLADYTAAEKGTFTPAFAYLIQSLKAKCPEATIIVVINSHDDGENRPGIKKTFCDAMAAVAEHFGVLSVQLHGISKTSEHPNAVGMTAIADQVYAAWVGETEVDPSVASAVATTTDASARILETSDGLVYVFKRTGPSVTLTAKDNLQVVKAILVGGGGGGGGTLGGGGGGGAVKMFANGYIAKDTVVTLSIGDGGAAGNGRSARGASGGATTLSYGKVTLSAAGGGGGAAWGAVNGLDGGNGGGGAGGWPTGATPNVAGIGGKSPDGGHVGGDGYVLNANDHAYNAPGGGGGAGGDGASATKGAAGNGGAAVAITIQGDISEYYGGGGGGGSGNSVVMPGKGGQNAGDGAPFISGARGVSAPNGFGGGGGGGGFTGGVDAGGGAGGSGAIILVLKGGAEPPEEGEGEEGEGEGGEGEGDEGGDDEPSAGRTVSLPSGYVLLKNIEGTGSSYLNTGVHPTADLVVTMTIEPMSDDSSGERAIIGTEWSATGFMPIFKSLAVWFYSNGTSVNTPSLSLGKQYQLTFDGAGMSIVQDADTTNRLNLANGFSAADKPIYVYNGFGGRHGCYKLFAMQMTVGGKVVRDYVPVMNGSGVTGLYDLVDHSGEAGYEQYDPFKPSETATAFKAGDPMFDEKTSFTVVGTHDVVCEEIAYGTLSVRAGDRISAPEFVVTGGTKRYRCLGYRIYRYDANQDAFVESFGERSTARAYVVRSSDVGNGVRFEWQWQVECQVLADGLGDGTMSLDGCDFEPAVSNWFQMGAVVSVTFAPANGMVHRILDGLPEGAEILSPNSANVIVGETSLKIIPRHYRFEDDNLYCDISVQTNQIGLKTVYVFADASAGEKQVTFKRTLTFEEGLVVAGGGAGKDGANNNQGGGGGGGGVIYLGMSDRLCSAGSKVTVSVGAGGKTTCESGKDSIVSGETFGTFRAVGGGGGCDNRAFDGGSGGGVGYGGIGGKGVSGQGNNGGGNGGIGRGSGGGGGADEHGGNAVMLTETTARAGKGGDGRWDAITGQLHCYGSGGGGGLYGSVAFEDDIPLFGAGGAESGGRGGVAGNGVTTDEWKYGVDGVNGLGGGGGGAAAFAGAGRHGNGGDGTVVLAFTAGDTRARHFEFDAFDSFPLIDGEAKPEPVIRNVTTHEVLANGTDYALSYENNCGNGQAYLVITGLDNTIHAGIVQRHPFRPASVIYVKPDGLPAADGMTWATAKDLKSAVDELTNAVHEIWCAAGNYVLAETVVIRGEGALHGGYAADDARPDLLAANGAQTVFDGGGELDCVMKDTFAPASDKVLSTCVKISNCTFKRGAKRGFEKSGTSRIVFDGCTFVGNRTDDETKDIHGLGFYAGNNGGAEIRFTDCQFVGNLHNATWPAGAGVVCAENANLVIDGCEFTSNGVPFSVTPTVSLASGYHPSAAVWSNGGQLTIRNSRFAANGMVGDNYDRSIVYRNGDSCLIENCAFVGNQVSSPGDGVAIGSVLRINAYDQSSNIVRNCTFAFNLVDCTTGAAIYANGGVLKVENCIFRGSVNRAGSQVPRDIVAISESRHASLSYSMFDSPDFGGEFTTNETKMVVGKGIVAGDPLFVTKDDDVAKCMKVDSVRHLFAADSESSVASINVHLRGPDGYLDEKTGLRVKIGKYSPAVDAGDPKSDYSREPAENKNRRVNLGCYGNTPYATRTTPRRFAVIVR